MPRPAPRTVVVTDFCLAASGSGFSVRSTPIPLSPATTRLRRARQPAIWAPTIPHLPRPYNQHRVGMGNLRATSRGIAKR